MVLLGQASDGADVVSMQGLLDQGKEGVHPKGLLGWHLH